MEFFLVIEQGLNLMLTGMMTVFIFLGMLILLINLSSLIFKETSHQNNKDQNNQPYNIISNRCVDVQGMNMIAGHILKHMNKNPDVLYLYAPSLHQLK